MDKTEERGDGIIMKVAFEVKVGRAEMVDNEHL